MVSVTPFLSIFVPSVTAVFLAAFTLYLVRLVKGPSVPDIVLAIDCLSFDLAVFMALLSIFYGTPYLVFGSILLALWAFLLDIFVAKYLLRRRLSE